VEAKKEGEYIITQKGRYRLTEPSLKEKITAVSPFLIILAGVVFLTDLKPSDAVGAASAFIGVLGGILYGLFYPWPLILLLISLFFGYEYRFAVAYFLFSFAVTGIIIFWLKAKKVKTGTYVLSPPLRKRNC